MNTKSLYALTHINRDGQRQLTRPNQGRNHWVTREMGEVYLRGFLDHNTDTSLSEIFGPQSIGTFRIRQVKCHLSGDAIRTIFS